MGKIKLWKKQIPLNPRLKRIETELASAIIQKMYPNCSEEMKKGAVYSHYGLTTVFESVQYTIEYLIKKGLLKNDTPRQPLANKEGYKNGS